MASKISKPHNPKTPPLLRVRSATRGGFSARDSTDCQEISISPNSNNIIKIDLVEKKKYAVLLDSGKKILWNSVTQDVWILSM